MPAFQAPEKRKSDAQDNNPTFRKRIAFDRDGEANSVATRGTGGSNASAGEQYWMVQWCGYLTFVMHVHAHKLK